MDRLHLLSGWRSETFEGVFQLAIHEVGVNQSCGEVSVAECALHNQDVACSAVEVSGEGVSKRVWAELLVDTCRLEPVVESPGNLSLAEPLTSIGEKKGLAFSVARPSALCQVGSQEGA